MDYRWLDQNVGKLRRSARVSVAGAQVRQKLRQAARIHVLNLVLDERVRPVLLEIANLRGVGPFAGNDSTNSVQYLLVEGVSSHLVMYGNALCASNPKLLMIHGDNSTHQHAYRQTRSARNTGTSCTNPWSCYHHQSRCGDGATARTPNFKPSSSDRLRERMLTWARLGPATNGLLCTSPCSCQ